MDLRGKLADAAREAMLTLPSAAYSALDGLRNGHDVDVTDLIIDSGSNSDGEWVKMAEGTIICWRDFPTAAFNSYFSNFTSSNSTATGIVVSEDTYFNLPKTFLSRPVVAPAGGRNFGDGRYFDVRASFHEPSQWRVMGISIGGASLGASMDFSLIAIGK